MRRRWRGNATAAGCFSDGANCHDDLAVECTVGQRGKGGRREIKTKAANSCVLVLFFCFLGGGLARYVLAELSVVSCVGGSSGQGRGNAEASSAASLLRHGALRVDPLH